MLTKGEGKDSEKENQIGSPEIPLKKMKPSLVADEMFPEGAGPYMDIEEVRYEFYLQFDDSPTASTSPFHTHRPCSATLLIL